MITYFLNCIIELFLKKLTQIPTSDSTAFQQIQFMPSQLSYLECKHFSVLV